MRVGGLRVGGLLDRYVARLFCLSYLTAFFLVVGLSMIMDVAVHVEDYLRAKEGVTPSTWQVAHYYLLSVPFVYLDMSPYVTLIAGMFTASKMSRFREIVAALNAGVSARRVFAPVVGASVLLAGGMFALREWATADISSKRAALEDYLDEGREFAIYEDVWVRDEQRRKIHLREYRTAGLGEGKPEARGLSSRYPGAEGPVSVVASRAIPLEGGQWRLFGGERVVASERALPTESLDTLEELRFTPADVELYWKAKKNPMQLSFSESRYLLRRDPTNAQYRTLFHYHVTFPIAGILLLLVGLPFVVRQERGNAGERVAKGFFLCVAYFGIEFVMRTLGLQGEVSPLFASWLPVVGFGALGAVLFGSMRS